MKILLIDDHEIFAMGLIEGVKKYDVNQSIKQIDMICQKIKISEIIDSICDNKYDILLLDINIKKIIGIDGFSLMKRILECLPKLKIIVITGYEQPYFEEEASNLGAYAFVGKEISSQSLYNIIKDVYEGKKYFNLVDNNTLTQRELEILKLYANGMTRNEVASKLFISTRTLANHLSSIYEKLSVSNYQEMIVRAAELGYIKYF